MSEPPANHRTRNGIIVAAVIIVCIGALAYVGWAIFNAASSEHISISSATVKLMLLGLIFGLLAVLFQRGGRKGR